MSSAASMPEPVPAPEYAVTIASHLTHHMVIPAKQGSKAKPKDKKGVKTKELSHLFLLTMDNYIKLLKAILAKHSEEKYNVTEKKCYVFKVICPPAKVKEEAIDIENFNKFKELADNIIARKPSKITIYIDMADIQEAWHTRGSGGGSDDEANEDADLRGLSKFDYGLARFRGLLERRYLNNHDMGYTYVHRDGTSLPLSPLMMKEWARACYEGEATVKAPPLNETFDPVKRHAILNSPHVASSVTTLTTAITNTGSGASDIAHIASIIAAIIGNCPPLPITPPQSTAVSPNVERSPCKPTPSKLQRFLLHVEQKLGIPNASSYETALRNKGYGPDILHLVPNDELTDSGMLSGDAICLKAGCVCWWNSPEAKRKHNDTDGSDSSRTMTPSNKKVRYEKRYRNGGGSTFFGPTLVPGHVEYPDYELHYYCSA